MITKSNKSASFLENILTLKHFFERNDHSAFLFAVCDSYHVRKEVNEQLIAYCEGKEKQTGTVELIPDIADGFLTQLRKAKQQYNSGLILTNIDTLIDHTDGVFAYDLNHMREGLIALKTPILIWLNRQNHTIITQKAIDLYLRRDLSTLFFDDAVRPPKEGMLERFTEATREAADFEETQMRISLLEQQLEETKGDDLHRSRIANEVVLPLIKAYVQNSMLIRAKELLSEYKEDFDYKKAQAHEIIASLFKETGNLDYAILHYEKALAIYSKQNGEDSIESTSLYNLLGMTYQEKGDLDAAILYLDKAINTIYNQHKDENNIIAIIYNNLGQVWQDKGNLNKAIEYLNRSLDIWQNNSNDENAHVAIGLNNLGNAWIENGDLNKGIDYIEKALNINLKIFGEESKNVASNYNNLGQAWQDKKDLEKALEFIIKALKIDLKLFGEESLYVARDYNNLGMAFLDLGDLDQAIKFINKSNKIDIKLLGDENLNVARDYNNLGMVFREKGDLKMAFDYLKKSYNIILKLYGASHPKTIATKKNYDLCLSEKNKTSS